MLNCPVVDKYLSPPSIACLWQLFNRNQSVINLTAFIHSFIYKTKKCE